MKTKKLTPRNAAPVQRENTATVSRDGNAIAPISGVTIHMGFLLRETTQSNPPDSSTNLKKCQKTFSPCQGARFASRNWPTTLVNSWLSDTWNPGRSFLSRGERERGSTGFCSSVVSLFLGWGVLKDLDSGRWTPANSLLPQGYRVAVFFSLGLYFWQKPLYFLAHSSKLSPSLRKAGCHWVKPSSVKRS
jgi:prenylated cyclic peptide (anacyclamide/piricyclamide family)